MTAFEQAFAMLKEFDFRPREQMKRIGSGSEEDFHIKFPAQGSFGPNPIGYDEVKEPFKIRPNRTLADGTPVGYVQSGSREQRDLYPEIWGDMPEGRRPRVPHHRIGTSRPRPIRQNKEGKDQWVGVNLPSMAQDSFNYTYSPESIVNDKNIKYITDVLNHEWGHALIDDDLKDEDRRGDLEHEFGAYTMQGLDFDEIQEQLRSRRLIE